jgi:hypothetical protein
MVRVIVHGTGAVAGSHNSCTATEALVGCARILDGDRRIGKVDVEAQITVGDQAVIARASKPFVIGTGHVTIPGHKTGKLKLKLSKQALKYLRKHHKLKAKLTLTTTAAGLKPTKVTKRVTLRS